MSSEENAQQFCLRWHNYQSSLLATLPQLLDGDDLTDVTLCAGSRSLKAHRVVLSACSEYFKELFKELGPSHHPVIVLPGVEFADLCALVTFMYSGEVNIYEPQLPGLLSMADTLHIRGLADFSHTTNIASKAAMPKQPKRSRASSDNSHAESSPTAAKTVKCSAGSSGGGGGGGSNSGKQPSLTETEPYTADWNMATTPSSEFQDVVHDLSKRMSSGTPPDDHANNNVVLDSGGMLDFNKKLEYSAFKFDNFISTAAADSMACGEDGTTMTPTDLTQTVTEITKPPKSAVSKTYTTCFVCGKQLSNHYNLRVHMETHQNVQYACSACNHVSRSRDALRKHVSYRHPVNSDGNPSGGKKHAAQVQPQPAP